MIEQYKKYLNNKHENQHNNHDYNQCIREYLENQDVNEAIEKILNN
jgi:hypothetical protein